MQTDASAATAARILDELIVIGGGNPAGASVEMCGCFPLIFLCRGFLVRHNQPFSSGHNEPSFLHFDES